MRAMKAGQPRMDQAFTWQYASGPVSRAPRRAASAMSRTQIRNHTTGSQQDPTNM